MLIDIPLWALQKTALTHIQTQKFFPKISELRQGALALVEQHRPRPAWKIVPPPMPSPELKAHLQQLFGKPPLVKSMPPAPREMTEEEIAERRRLLKAQADFILARERTDDDAIH